MDKIDLIKTIKEKGPILALGALGGALAAATILHHKEIHELLDATLKRFSSRGKE